MRDVAQRARAVARGFCVRLIAVGGIAIPLALTAACGYEDSNHRRRSPPPVAANGHRTDEPTAEPPEEAYNGLRTEYPEEADNGSRTASREESDNEPTHTLMQVFYGTDRKWTGSPSSPKFYGSERGPGDPTELGYCYVSIPPGHERGEIERPKWWKAEFRENPERHVMLLSAERLQPEGFYSKLQYVIGQTEQEQAFVFVHGYNVTFEQAAWRTAQIAYDVGFDGAPVMYSWPAQGELLRYPADETNAQWTQPHLARFLAELRTRSGAKKIHLIVHSMGARPLSHALCAMRTAEPSKVFNQIVLAAPDIDREVFEEQIAPRLVPSAERVTIYVSANDKALIASRKFHDNPRLGEGGANRVTFPAYPGIDVIDTSEADTSVIGHFYYGENSPVLRDLGYVLAGVPAADTERRLRIAIGYFDLLED